MHIIEFLRIVGLETGLHFDKALQNCLEVVRSADGGMSNCEKHKTFSESSGLVEQAEAGDTQFLGSVDILPGRQRLFAVLKPLFIKQVGGETG